jgi:uncharacterized protein (DUF305 family)
MSDHHSGSDDKGDSDHENSTDSHDMKNMNHDMNGMQGMMHHGDVKSEEQFIIDMIPHHQEAVDTSNQILARSTNEDVKKLAQGIVDAQTKEISTMQ